MKICPSCGSELADDLAFCPSDGSPLLSEEEEPEADDEPVGEATVVMSDSEGIGDATVFMGDDDDEEETVTPDSEAAEPAGDKTLVMSDLPDEVPDEEPLPPSADEFVTEDVPQPIDEEPPYAAGSETDASDDTQEWSEESAGESTAEWTGEFQEPDEDYSATVVVGDDEPMDDGLPPGDWVEEEPSEYEEQGAAVVAVEASPEEPAKKSGSKLGLIIGLLAVFFVLVIIVVAAAGVFYYLSTRSTEVANTNTEQAANGDLNADATPEESGDDAVPGSDDNVNAGQSPSPDGNTNRSPSPSPTKSPKSPTPTPTRSPDRNGQQPTPDRIQGPLDTPTPVRSTPTPNIPSRISKGVVNGSAISLPKPVYPAAARAVNAKGSVNVAVVIDRTGNVVSANAVSGHPLLRGPAETAARRARFRPTLLSGQPVEVQGVIVYNFQ